MSARMIVELPDGSKIGFGAATSRPGLAEVAKSGGTGKVAADKFEQALGSLASLVGVLETALDKVAKKPDKVEMEFGATLTGDCDLWIVSAHGEAEMKVTLTWGDKA